MHCKWMQILQLTFRYIVQVLYVLCFSALQKQMIHVRDLVVDHNLI